MIRGWIWHVGAVYVHVSYGFVHVDVLSNRLTAFNINLHGLIISFLDDFFIGYNIFIFFIFGKYNFV